MSNSTAEITTHTQGRELRSLGIANFVIAALWVLVVALTFTRLTTAPLEHDESFTLSIALLPWRQAWAAAVADASHPPIFTMVVKAWIAVGGASLVWLRILPAIIVSLLPAPFLLIANELRAPKMASVLGLVLLLANPTRIYYAHNARSYGLLMLLSAFSIWLFARLTRNKWPSLRLWMAYWLVNVALCSTHYFGLWVVGIQGLIALAFYRKQVLHCVIGAVVIVFANLFWVPAARQSMTRRGGLAGYTGWMPLPTFKDVAWYYNGLIGGLNIRHATQVGLLLFLVPLFLWSAISIVRWHKAPDARRRAFIHLLPYATLPVIGTFFLSHVAKTPLFAERVLIFAVVPFCLALGIALVSIPYRELRVSLYTVLIAWTASGGAITISDLSKDGVRWDILAQCIDRDPGASAPVRAREDWLALPFAISQRIAGKARDIQAVKHFDSDQPDEFWAAYRVFPETPEYKAGIVSELRSADYKTIRSCEVGDGTIDRYVIFDLESRQAP